MLRQKLVLGSGGNVGKRRPKYQPPDYASEAYQANVRAWVRSLRHEDAKSQHEQAFRDSRKGDLNTGGLSGVAKSCPVPHPAEDGHFVEKKQ
jgi:hypothetical protein